MFVGCMYICMCTGVYVCVWGVGVYVLMCVGGVCRGVGMYVCVWGCMDVCGCMHVRVSVYIGTRERKETGSTKGNQ